MNYESTIIIEPVFMERLEEVKCIANKYLFNVTELYAKKTILKGCGNDFEETKRISLNLMNDLTIKNVLIHKFKLNQVLIEEDY